MFKWIKEKRQAALNAKYAEEDKEKNYIRGRRIGNVRYYDNGLKGFLFKNAEGKDKIRLETADGKVVEEECDEICVCNWHHGFVFIDWTYLPFDELIDCVGNSIFCHGVVFSDKRTVGDNLWLIPVCNNKYLIYNHVEHTITKNPSNGSDLKLDGINKDESGKFIKGVIRSEEDVVGYGDLAEKTYYDEEFIIDRDGVVLSVEKKNVRKTKNLEKNDI